MVLGACSVMIVVLVAVLLLCRFSPRTAYRVLEHSQLLFEPDEAAATPARAAPRHRPYITPLVKKRVAAKQKWRCASCRSLLDETYEIDHIKPLFKGGTNVESNVQALCKRCHTMKSAVEQSSR